MQSLPKLHSYDTFRTVAFRSRFVAIVSHIPLLMAFRAFYALCGHKTRCAILLTNERLWAKKGLRVWCSREYATAVVVLAKASVSQVCLSGSPPIRQIAGAICLSAFGHQPLSSEDTTDETRHCITIHPNSTPQRGVGTNRYAEGYQTH
jgi:hypothetical protein